MGGFGQRMFVVQLTDEEIATLAAVFTRLITHDADGVGGGSAGP